MVATLRIQVLGTLGYYQEAADDANEVDHEGGNLYVEYVAGRITDHCSYQQGQRSTSVNYRAQNFLLADGHKFLQHNVADGPSRYCYYAYEKVRTNSQINAAGES